MNFLLVLRSPWFFGFLVIATCCLPGAESRSDEPDEATNPVADSMLGKEAGQIRDDNALRMKLVWCPPGSFTMELAQVTEEPATTDESDDDTIEDSAPKGRRVERFVPVRVGLTRGYWLGKYEVTQAEWTQLMATEPWAGQNFTKEGDDFPATWINWEEAMDFCRKLTVQERKARRLPDDWEYTLPTEAQWERACRARTQTKFSFGDDESISGEYSWMVRNTHRDGEQYAHRVGQKKPNPWGLYDMHGNVWEWCRDFYLEKLPGGRDPGVTEKGSVRVIRSGDWRNYVCRSAFRVWRSPVLRDFDCGFRLALSSVRQATPAKAPRTTDK